MLRRLVECLAALFGSSALVALLVKIAALLKAQAHWPANGEAYFSDANL
jgi:hypothetical protein